MCPRAVLAITSKCKALNKLKRWDVSKKFCEDKVCSAGSSILKLQAHPLAKFLHTEDSKDIPKSSQVKWTINKKHTKRNAASTSPLSVDLHSVVELLLCMHAPLAEQYVIALKNVEACHVCCADVMSNVMSILGKQHVLLVVAGCHSLTND